MVKNPLANAGDRRDVGSIPGLGRSPGGGRGKPLQYSCLKNPRGPQRSWWAIESIVLQNWTPLKRLRTHAIILTLNSKRDFMF